MVERMVAEGHELSVMTCNFLLNACSQSGDLARAQEYLQQMLRQNVVPDQVTYNSLINGCAIQGDVAAVEGWLHHMMSVGVRPNSVTFGTVCKAFARVGDVEKVERVMQALDDAGLELNEYFYAALISACAEARQAHRAEHALSDLAKRGLRPSAVRSAMGRAVGRRRANQLISHYERLAEARAAREAEKGGGVKGKGATTAYPSAPTTAPLQCPPGLVSRWPEAPAHMPVKLLREREDAQTSPARQEMALPGS